MTTIKKKDYDKLVQAAKYLERVEYLLKQVKESSPIVTYMITDWETIESFCFDFPRILEIEIRQFKTK